MLTYRVLGPPAVEGDDGSRPTPTAPKVAQTLELRIQADFALDRYRDLIGELRFLVARYPYHEWFHAQLIDALHRSGRRGDALKAFQNLRTILAEDLGLEPSRSLTELELSVLSD